MTATAALDTAPPRRRLSPDERRNEILDATARVIMDEGVSAVSMEGVAREAQASKALVYAYFENRQNLLTSLLLREFPAFQGDLEPLPADAPFEAMIRRTTIDFIDRYVANGVLIQRLLAEPAVAEDTLRRQKIGRELTARYFADLMHRQFGVPPATGRNAAKLLMGVTSNAARMLMQEEIEHDALIDLTVALLVGAAKALGDRHAL
jgi:TetR/AcrR family transcriptional regulator, fatty acid biosynthesis regulator